MGAAWVLLALAEVEPLALAEVAWVLLQIVVDVGSMVGFDAASGADSVHRRQFALYRKLRALAPPIHLF